MTDLYLDETAMSSTISTTTR